MKASNMTNIPAPIEFLKDHSISIFNNMCDSVCVFDRHGRIQFVNDAFSRLFGVNSNRILNRNIRTVIKSEIFKTPICLANKNNGELIYFNKTLQFKTTKIVENNQIKGYLMMFYEMNNVSLYETSHELNNPFSDVIGHNKSFVKSLVMANKAAKKHVTILLRGESGTGKELIARKIHEASYVSNGPFIAINCAAIPDNLLESELFGYEVGAFTGALSRKKGQFELAEDGTIFLDEIGDLPINLQSKLLRVLQEKCIKRIGGSIEIPIHVRVIAATHHDLENMIIEKTFRQDLYYRLNVISIELTPLRDRKDDIPELLEFIKDKMIKRHKLENLVFTEEVIKALMSYDWSGNIRELSNVIERAVIFAETEEVTLSNLPSMVTNRYEVEVNNNQLNLFNFKPDGNFATLEAYNLEIIHHAVKTHGSFHAASKVLGINHKTVASKYRKFMSSSLTDVSSSF